MRVLSSFILGLFIAATAMANDAELSTRARLAKPIDVPVNFNENDLKKDSWMSEFRYVVVANKANKGKTAQTIRIYEYGKLIQTDKVSTGRESFEKKGTNHSKVDAWTVTPTGYYTPNWISELHKSSQYGTIFSGITGGTRMPYAIFFNGGIAFHEVPAKSAGRLGNRASGGCIRLPSDLAKDLFYRIKETYGVKNPRFTTTGQPMLDKQGNQLYAENAGYSALIIVENNIVE